MHVLPRCKRSGVCSRWPPDRLQQQAAIPSVCIHSAACVHVQHMPGWMLTSKVQCTQTTPSLPSYVHSLVRRTPSCWLAAQNNALYIIHAPSLTPVQLFMSRHYLSSISRAGSRRILLFIFSKTFALDCACNTRMPWHHK